MKILAEIIFASGAIVTILGYSGRLKGQHERKWLAMSLFLVALGGGYLVLTNI